MKRGFHKFVLAAVAAAVAVGANADDAAGVMRASASNESVTVVMPFSPFLPGTPAYFLAGPFMGDGGAFSDMLHVAPADGSTPTNAVYSTAAGGWLDPATGEATSMTAGAGDALVLDPGADSTTLFDFLLFGRLPAFAGPSGLPRLSGMAADPLMAFVDLGVAGAESASADLLARDVLDPAAPPGPWRHVSRLPPGPRVWRDAPPVVGAARHYIVSDASRDTDGDGIPDALEERVFGTSPLLADTDGDGVSDRDELAWGADPLVASSAVPFTLFEGFERPAVLPGALGGQNGWTLSATDADASATVQTNDVHGGEAALRLDVDAGGGSVSRPVSPPAGELWLDMRLRTPDCADMEIPADAAVAFAFDGMMRPVLTDGPSVVTSAVRAVSRDWTRCTMRLDCAARRWDFYLDGVLAAAGLAMRGNAPAPSELGVSGGSALVDDVSLTTTRPAGLSADCDHMADEWEMAHFGSLVRDGTGDFDSDGLSDADEFRAGTDPAVPDTDGDGIPDAWEVAHGLAPLDPSDASADPDGDGMTNAEEFAKGGDPNFSEPDPTLSAPGLRAEFFRTVSGLTGPPRPDALMPSGDGVSPRIDHPAAPWPQTAPADWFACRFTGFIRIDRAGTWRFRVMSDDGATLRIDGDEVVRDEGPHSPTAAAEGAVALSAGWHPVEIDYYENAGGETLMLGWSRPGRWGWEIVPDEAFCHIPADEAPAGLASGLAAAYYSFQNELSSMPDFSSLSPVDSRVVARIDQPAASGAWADAPSSLLERFGAVYSGFVRVPKSGVWNVTLESDDGSRLWIDGSLAIDHGELHGMSAKSAVFDLSEGLHALRVEYFENTGNAGLRLLWALEGFPSEAVPARYLLHGVPSDSDGDGMPDWWETAHGFDPSDASDAAIDADADGLSNLAECLAGTDPRSPDTDSDGMPDAWEVSSGTRPFVPDALDDPDGDGLSNAEELRLGTNPRSADTDGDGATDWTEACNIHSDPLAVDVAWPPTAVSDAVSGSSFTASTGQWRGEDGVAYSVGRAGSLTWRLSVPTGGVDAIAVRIGGGTAQSDGRAYDLALYVDGVFMARETADVPSGECADVYFFLPELSPGEHDFRVVWRNWDVEAALAVHDLRFVKFGGPDSDGDGVPDWKETRASQSSALDAPPAESLVSPLCVEGRDLWRDALEVEVAWPSTNMAFAAKKTIGDGFYADVPLPPDGSQATVSMRGRTPAAAFPVSWRALDVFEGEFATNALVVRAGDSLRIAPCGDESDVTISVADGEDGWTAVTNWTETAATPYAFTTNGLFLVTVTRGGILSDDTAHALVEVVDSRFPKRSPAILKDAAQTLECPGLSPRCLLEHDAGLAVDAETVGGGVSLTMLARADRPLGLVSRLFEGGPICDAVQVSPLWADNGSYFHVNGMADEGFETVEISLLLGARPEGVSVVLEIFVAGVTFEDGTRTKTLTAEDFDEDGFVVVRFLKARGVTTSVCHRTYIYQDGNLLYSNR